MKKYRWIWAVPGGLLLAAFAHVSAGGWAVVTVEDLPDHAVAGQPLTLNYAVRQHGEDLMPNLNGTVSARSGREQLSVKARPAARRGYYTATLTLPDAGEWTITIASGFGRSRTALVPLRAITPGSTPPVLEPAERGRRLFVAKGCVTCHTRDDTEAEMGKGGVDLTGRTFAPRYLADFLANPKMKPSAQRNGWQMPALDLDQPEIASLVAFINSSRRVAHNPH